MNRQQRRQMKKKFPKPPEQVKKETHGDILSQIISETFVRHRDLSEEEFLERIGFKDSGMTEDEAVRTAMFNVMVAATKELLQAEGTLNMANAAFRLHILGEDLTEEIKENGREESGSTAG